MTDTAELPKFRYNAALANEVEARWQERWEHDETFAAPNSAGELSDRFDAFSERTPIYILDMFPYPSSEGLHVGHPLGFIGTDVFARYCRMTGYNVVHTMGFDAFGLPAEEYARQTGAHPRVTTESNIVNYRRQLRALGLGHDVRRSIATTDVDYYRWTQWIFLQLFTAWYDETADRARPIGELVAELEAGERPTPDGTAWAELDDVGRRRVVDSCRLAYLAEAPVNWCPALGTVLANEEVTSDGRSDRGNHPVFRRSLKQWMLRITSYADRLIADLDALEWPESIKVMQRNWIGRSVGALLRFAAGDRTIEAFTTRPDTIFGATYMVLAPEHPLVDVLTAPDTADAVADYRSSIASMSEVDRQVDTRDKTGVFIGTNAINPANGVEIPIYVADYVLMGYGTGAIMGVPGQDQRDWDFAEAFGVDIVRTVQPPDDFEGGAYLGEGPAINSGFLDGLGVEDAKQAIIEWLELNDAGERTITYKLRDWLFSRQRYWGEPFPIVYDETGLPIAVPEDQLPVELPDLDDWAPRAVDEDAEPEPPLGRATDWVTATLDVGDGLKEYRREINVMPQWAGSCWYHLRYLDPTNDEALIDPIIDRYWMADDETIGGVDLYVGGVEHAVLHLLYARFWQKVLFDLGHVSTAEPYYRLFNQGYILADAFRDDRGMVVPAAEVVLQESGEYHYDGEVVTREAGKMGQEPEELHQPR